MNKDIVKDVIELKEHNEHLLDRLNSTMESLHRIKIREALYQSTLQNLKNDLRKFYERIDITPHSSNPEYRENFYSQDSKYKKALDEIEKYQRMNCETCVFNKTEKCGISCQKFVILDIINKAKNGK